MTTSDPVAEQLVAARRKQILDAATTVFGKQGFHRTTIREIAREAGVADGTIYNYFGSKDDLLIGLLDRLNESEQRDEQLGQLHQVEFQSFMATYLRQRIELLRPNYELLHALLPELLANPVLKERYYQQVVAPSFALAERHFQALAAAGQLREIDLPLTVRSMAATLLGLLILQMLGDEEVECSWDQLPEVLATLFSEGLLPEEQR